MNGKSPADRILMLLKTRGQQSAADLGLVLQTTAEAVRQQLVKLASDDLVEPITEARKVGRPQQFWQLTAAGHARFPDSHAELTTRLIDAIRTVLGEESLELVINQREKEMLELYGQELAGVGAFEQKLDKLAELRSREGYMCEWQREGNDYLLIENHCPICAAAATCQGFCRTELSLFKQVLETENIVRLEHIIKGGRRCVYKIAAPN